MATVKKAIILTAGYGTRRLPITKALEKCMLPIGNRPLIDYIVEDCITAGITEIMFVVGEQSDQIRTYYGTNQLLEEYLGRLGKKPQLEQVKDIARKANFHYVVQSSSMPYGTAVPVDLCSFWVGADEQVLVAAGDNFLYRTDGKSDIARLLASVEADGTTAGLLVSELPREQLIGGVIELKEDGKHFKGNIENANPEDMTSNLFNASKYLFDRAMFDYAHKVMMSPPAPNGEYQVTEALNAYVQDGGQILVERSEGTYLDGGSLNGWLHANNVVLGQ
ncbi:MAG TPA: sugar phosphate nucleotidyltransferase [Patescibacteria group bacterium]|nr:sugar phosphate nucleotidyltransferase [Patescibacteria group bacterium]